VISNALAFKDDITFFPDFSSISLRAFPAIVPP